MAFLYYRKSTFSGLLSATARTSDGHLGLRGSINWGWGQFSIGQRRSIARRGRRVVSGFYEAGNCDSRLYWQKETTTYYFWYSKQNDSGCEAKMGKQPSNLIRTIVCSLTILSLLDSSKWLSGDSPITSVSTHWYQTIMLSTEFFSLFDKWRNVSKKNIIFGNKCLKLAVY